MAFLYKDPSPTSEYRDFRSQRQTSDITEVLRLSSTLYVGNLSFYTTEEQIYELFSRCGEIKRIIMGLDKIQKTPCGFCFVEYFTHEEAADCMKYINGTRLDDRVIRTDWDAGFQDGRQYGRGKTGGQVRDEYRTDYDPGRGGYGKQRQLLLSDPSQQQALQQQQQPQQGYKRDRSSDDSYDSRKRQKGDEKNPRFREKREESDDEDNST